jgi:NAD-dependent SIR2 family protein deacetylase
VSGAEEVRHWRLSGGRIVPTRGRFYAASCDGCGWAGSSEECGTDYAGGDDTDVYCPKCQRAGADFGKLGERAKEVRRHLSQPNTQRGTEGR